MNINPLTPELDVSDINNSKDFYVNVLGFKIEYERVDDKFAFLSFEDNVQIMLSQVNNDWLTANLDHPFGRGINFQIYTNKLSKIYSSVKENNLPLFRDIQVANYRMDNKSIIQKEFLIQDPDGYLLRFAENIGC